MSTARISFEFLKRLNSMPSWAGVAYGFEHQLLSPNVVIDYAIYKTTATDEPNDDEIAIASSSASDSITEPVQKLAMNDVKYENNIRLLWANILLAWVYEHRNQYDDLLGIVEKIYSDYNYPEELASFVRYMPNDATDLGSVEANEQRMITSIGEYVGQYLFPKNT